MVNMPTRVLVVDQNEGVRSRLTSLLEGRGFQVRATPSRHLGFDLLDELIPDLLILDDPGAGPSYRLIWLREDREDVHVELVELEHDQIATQLDAILANSAA